jgi:hypothetical protein
MPQPDYEFGFATFVKLRRLAIRAAKFEPEANYAIWTVIEIHSDGISVVEKNEGPIRIPLHSQLFLFNALAFPCIPSKALKFRLVVFSIPLSLPTSRLRKHKLTTVRFPTYLPFSFLRSRRTGVRSNVGSNCDALPNTRTLGMGRFGTNALSESPGVTSCFNGTRRRRDV